MHKRVIGATVYSDLKWVVFSEGALMTEKMVVYIIIVRKKAVPISIILIIKAIIYVKHSKYFTKDILKWNNILRYVL